MIEIAILVIVAINTYMLYHIYSLIFSLDQRFSAAWQKMTNYVGELIAAKLQNTLSTTMDKFDLEEQIRRIVEKPRRE